MVGLAADPATTGSHEPLSKTRSHLARQRPGKKPVAVGKVVVLARLGYVYRPEFEAVLPDRRYFRKCAGDVHTHHLHMAEVDGAFWRRHLAFRDYLRSHPETAQEYGRLKRELAARFVDNVDAYTDAKTEFITAVETKAQGSM